MLLNAAAPLLCAPLPSRIWGGGDGQVEAGAPLARRACLAQQSGEMGGCHVTIRLWREGGLGLNMRGLERGHRCRWAVAAVRGTSEAKCPESSGCRSRACVQGDCSSHAKQPWVESFPYRVLVYIRARLLSVTFCQMKSPPPVIVTYRLLPKGTTPSSTLSVPLQSCPCSHVWGSGWVASRPPTTDVFVVTAGDPTAEWRGPFREMGLTRD